MVILTSHCSRKQEQENKMGGFQMYHSPILVVNLTRNILVYKYISKNLNAELYQIGARQKNSSNNINFCKRTKIEIPSIEFSKFLFSDYRGLLPRTDLKSFTANG
jgi:hypothetical protein